MESESSDDEFENISKADHGKIIEKMLKMGYKDGIHDGRESQFQKGFDDGYEQGFKHGSLLGKYKGDLWAEQLQQGTNAYDLLLHRPSRGQCVLCTNPALKEDTISNIVVAQSEHMARVTSALQTRYGPI